VWAFGTNYRQSDRVVAGPGEVFLERVLQIRHGGWAVSDQDR
jgi:hypothetical protein